MLKPISIFIVSAMMFAAIAKVGAMESPAVASHPLRDANRLAGEHEHNYDHEQEKKQKYTCAMHPEVITDHPGNCPKCGMKLVPIKNRKRSTSNVEHRTSNGLATETHESHRSHQAHETHQHEMEMHSSIALAEPMSREASGTSWL